MHGNTISCSGEVRVVTPGAWEWRPCSKKASFFTRLTGCSRCGLYFCKEHLARKLDWQTNQSVCSTCAHKNLASTDVNKSDSGSKPPDILTEEEREDEEWMTVSINQPRNNKPPLIYGRFPKPPPTQESLSNQPMLSPGIPTSILPPPVLPAGQGVKSSFSEQSLGDRRPSIQMKFPRKNSLFSIQSVLTPSQISRPISWAQAVEKSYDEQYARSRSTASSENAWINSSTPPSSSASAASSRSSVSSSPPPTQEEQDDEEWNPVENKIDLFKHQYRKAFKGDFLQLDILTRDCLDALYQPSQNRFNGLKERVNQWVSVQWEQLREPNNAPAQNELINIRNLLLSLFIPTKQ
jgi:hypothetical protein